MKLSSISLSVVAIVAGSLSVFSSSAQAFQFTSNITQSGTNAPKGDILLNKVDAQGQIRSKFSLVNKATIKYNDQFVGGNTGAASADRTDNATVGIVDEQLDTNSLIGTLNNRYLSNIIDTEDTGTFVFDLFFDKVVDNLFLWERGGTGNTYGNSHLDIQAIDAQGNLLGNLITAGKGKYTYSKAGYQLDTTEIPSAQNVGSLGISLSDLGLSQSIAGVRVGSKKGYNGPDWKLMGATDLKAVKATPEPSIALGLGAAALIGGLRKRSRKSA